MSATLTPPAGGDPMALAPGDADQDADDQVVVTICKNGDGSYTVYPGDEPESGAGDVDMSEDDVDALGPAGAAPAPGAAPTPAGPPGAPLGAPAGASTPQGMPADSIGAALKVALDILNADKSSTGAPGNADDQFAAGFGASRSPTLATGPAQKY